VISDNFFQEMIPMLFSKDSDGWNYDSFTSKKLKAPWSDHSISCRPQPVTPLSLKTLIAQEVDHPILLAM
jgi:hypothetical protein